MRWPETVVWGTPGSGPPPVVSTNSFVLMWNSTTSATVYGFELTVTLVAAPPTHATSGASTTDSKVHTRPWSTGVVWREHVTPTRGGAACCGDSTWWLEPGQTYTWRLEEYDGPEAVAAGTMNGTFHTSPSLMHPLDEARSVTFGTVQGNNEVYLSTMHSLADRVAPDGFFMESPYTQAYGKLMFVRSVGAVTMAFLELGRDDLAARVLNFTLALHERLDADYPGHTIVPEAGGNYSLEMIEQLDGSFHLITAWARYCALHPEDTDMFLLYYPRMQMWTHRYLRPFPAGSSAGTCQAGRFPSGSKGVHGSLEGYAALVGTGPLPYNNTLEDAKEFCCRSV